MDIEERRRRNRLAAQRYRNRQSESARAERLRKQREYARARRQQQISFNRNAVDCTERPPLAPVGAAARRKALVGLQEALGASGLDERVCGICDRFVLTKDSQLIESSDEEMVRRLHLLLSSESENLPPALAADYDCSEQAPSLAGLLLSKRGVTAEGTSTKIIVCLECNGSLCRGELPKFAIKNGFFVGMLPSRFTDTSVAERFMVQPVSVVAMSRVMRGGAHRSIRSHCLAFDASPGPPATLLPRRLENTTTYRVVLAGPFTDEQRAKVKKMYCIRRDRVEKLLLYFKDEVRNCHFADIAVDCSDIDENDAVERLFYETTEADIVSEIARDHDRVTDVADERLDDEDEVIERRVVFSENGRETSNFDEARVDDISENGASEPRFLVRHSSKFAQDDGSLFAKMFPHLFPYGRGHPGEGRVVPVSLHACIQYYGALSSRAFAEDELFTLVAFDYISMRNMYLNVSLRCKRHPRAFDGYHDISVDDLKEALRINERRRQGRLSATGNDDAATRFLRSVELSESNVWGSDAEREQCRRKAFAYQARFGQPALFVTLTPNVSSSFALAQYTGITSIDTLFNAPLFNPPDRAKVRAAAFKNDFASARLFVRNMDAFIEHVLGVHPRQMRGKPFDGLFGPVTAYFGMVETQGGGTLHAHFLVWLSCVPRNVPAYRKILEERGADFLQDIERYADSVVKTTFPLDISGGACRFCGESYADLRALKIPDEARMKALDDSASKQREPALLKCGRCLTCLSSQHVLKQVLLQNRPATWPPPMRDLDLGELHDQAFREARANNNFSGARHWIYERDFLLRLVSNDDDEYRAFLESVNAAQGSIGRDSHDNFKRDGLAQTIEMMPPSSDDLRWASDGFAFMVAMLVFLLNLHWWSHSSSCFKSSRAATRGSCRYGYPRDRVERTSFSSKGVQLQRQLGCEYINGYNDVMMATFKSNHDVQVLIGGEAVLDRIYYCCKYVTKHQNQVDSVAAVALAAFARRQDKEARAHAQHQLQDERKIDRQRVSSMTYALTSRREIAGPLAALYLLRKSCCYMSTPTTVLPLAEILKALLGSESYGCDLIGVSAPASDTNESGVYRSTSIFDDYRWRPSSLENMNLYEFVMKFFRRQRTSSTSEDRIFLSAHPLCQSHCLGKHRETVVPVITGVRMPFVDEDSPDEVVVKRSRTGLTLFKPFRTVSDLVEDCTSSDSWKQAYLDWEPHRSSFVQDTMENMNDYFRARDKASLNIESTDPDGSQSSQESDDDFADNDICAETNDDFIEMGLFSTDDYELFDEHGSADTVIPETNDLNPILYPSSQKQCDIVGVLAQHDLLAPSAQLAVARRRDILPSVQVGDTLTFGNECLSTDDLRRWVADVQTDDSLVLQSSPDDERPTQVIELLSEALRPENMSWSSNIGADSESIEVGSYASLQSISRANRLNERQHIAFCIAGKALLRRYYQQELAQQDNSDGYGSSEYVKNLQQDQLLMFLGGAGGTGKSRVIDAITMLCASWNRDHAMIKAALTGKAATLVGGRTLASLLLRLKHAIERREFADLDLIAIDEISMMTKKDWIKLDKLLRKYKKLEDIPFGGVHIILVGDFLQMPPVGSDPIYIDPSTKRAASLTDTAGFELWRLFTKVIVLEESMRFQSDPHWGEGCRRARLGDWSPDFIELINSKLVVDSGDAFLAAGKQSVFVTPENSTRLSINNAFVAETAARLPTSQYPIRVVADFRHKLDGLSEPDVQMVMGLPDNRFGRLAPYLDLIEGMPIQVTQNVATAKGVANGTLGTLEHVHFPGGTEFRLTRDSTSNVVVQIPNRPPEYALIRVPRINAVPIRPGTPPELFPVFYNTEAFKESSISLPPAPNGHPRVLTVKIRQLPIVCAAGSTVYKVQGETLGSMVVVDWKSKVAIVNKPQQIYLMVSRVTSRDAFLTLSPFTDELAKWAKPPRHAVEEDRRLVELSETTIANWYSY